MFCNVLSRHVVAVCWMTQLGFSPLHLAVQAGHEHIVHDFVAIDEIEIHKRARNGLTAVTLAEQGEREHPEIAKMLRDLAARRPPPSPQVSNVK